MKWFLKVVRDNYLNFKGRASREEYWMFTIFMVIFSIVAVVADNILGTVFTIGAGSYSVSMGYGWIYLIYMLAVIIPGCSVAVRRLHDVGKSGWFCLINFIPLIGAIWFLVLMCTDGDQTENTYGASPKS